jgi:hypothetical protein
MDILLDHFEDRAVPPEVGAVDSAAAALERGSLVGMVGGGRGSTGRVQGEAIGGRGIHIHGCLYRQTVCVSSVQVQVQA